MGKFIGGIVFALLVIAIGGYCYLKFGMVNMAADQTPSTLERRLAGTGLDASVEKQAADLKNPLEPTDAVLTEGMHIYVQDCAGCHGSPKETNSVFGGAFNPHVPQFVKRAPDMPDNENFYITKHGVRMTGMPAWGKLYDDDKLWKVTTFLSHMDKLPPAIDQEWKSPAAPQPPPASDVKTAKPKK
jgi:mono/diheme cytochrome c family protein